MTSSDKNEVVAKCGEAVRERPADAGQAPVTSASGTIYAALTGEFARNSRIAATTLSLKLVSCTCIEGCIGLPS